MNLRQRQTVVVPVVYVAAMFMAVLDTTIVNVALPTLGRDFHASASDVGLISIAYLISLTVFIPVSGWLGDRFGGRRALLGAVAVFTVGSALCGLATSLGELVAFRILQGAGGAVMTPVGLAMLLRVYPPAERVRLASTLAVFTALAPALGPVLGGLFTTYVSWRLVFFVNVPIGTAAFVFGAALLAGHTQPRPGRLDRPGVVLSGLGLGSLMYGLSEGPSRGWSSAPVLATLAAGAALLTALAVVELRTAAPLIDLRLFTNRLFSAATSLYGLGSVAYLGALYLATLFFQDALGLSAVASGLITFPSALGVMAGGQLVTRVLYRRFGPRRVVTAGLLVVAGATAAMALVGTGTSRWLISLIMFGVGLGISGVFIPAQGISMATISPAQTGRASAVFNAGKQLGGALGVALLTTVLATAGTTRHEAGHVVANLTAFHDGFLAAAAVAVVAVAAARTIRDADAAAMTPRPAGRDKRATRHEDRLAQSAQSAEAVLGDGPDGQPAAGTFGQERR
ncbi:MAG TPA: MDR family MFS transporter [Streptosporangiaceae bacterium]